MRTTVRHASPPSEEGLTAKVRRLPAVHPGEVLSEDLMKPLGLSINGLARELRVPVTRVSEIVSGRRSITADTALPLARYFAMTPYFWMNLQAAYDLDVATRVGRQDQAGRASSEGCVALLITIGNSASAANAKCSDR